MRRTTISVFFSAAATLTGATAVAVSADPTTQIASTQVASTQAASTRAITAGRDTPAGAMTVFEHALDSGDVATVADSINGLSETSLQSVARELVWEARFAKAVDARLGHDATVKICNDCRIRTPVTGVKYTDALWTISPDRPDIAIVQSIGGANFKTMGISLMQRGADGIWRIGRNASPEARSAAATRAAAIRAQRGITTMPSNPRVAQSDQMVARLQHTLDELSGEKLKTVEDVENSLYPAGSPMAQARAASARAKELNEQQEKKQQQAILDAHFDPSTLNGAVGAFVQAALRRDAAGMANLMFVSGAPDNSYVLASANRLLALGDFDSAAIDHNITEATGLASRFGLDRDAAFAPSLAWDQPVEHGDVGMISRGGEGKVAAWYRKVGGAVNGIWKQDVKLDIAPTRLARYTQDVQDDTAALQRITADISTGKLTTADQVRDALGNAALNCFSDPSFTVDPTRDYQNQPKSHNRPATAPAPLDPATPAGAMNRFVRATQSGDEQTVADCLWLPNDQNKAAASAMAHDYIVGVKFVRALQKDSPGWDPNFFCQSCDTLTPESLRDYGEDEWMIDPLHPDIAVSNNAYTARPDPPRDPPNGQNPQSYTLVHEWTPMMHRCPDGIWRLGPWYPQSTHQLQEQATVLAAKDQILEKATADLNADKVRSIDDLSNSINPQLKSIGAMPVTTMQPSHATVESNRRKRP